MPFTPYHFGPGALIKAIIPRSFSLIVFIFIQVIIDCETLYHLVKHQQPLHQFLHTYLGCNLAVIAALVVYKPLHQFFIGELSWGTTFVSAIIGAYSHVFLDSIMHYDIKPFAPFDYQNGMWHWMDVELLQLYCIFAAIAALIVLFFRSAFSKKK